MTLIDPRTYPQFDPLAGLMNNADLLLIWRDASGRNLKITYDQLRSQLATELTQSQGDISLQDLSNVQIVNLVTGATAIYDSASQTFRVRRLSVTDIQGLQEQLDDLADNLPVTHSPVTVSNQGQANGLSVGGNTGQVLGMRLASPTEAGAMSSVDKNILDLLAPL